MTRFLAYVPEALEAIWRNRTRSLLSVLGMVVGIASVITVLGLSQAGARGMKEMLSSGGDPGYFAAPDQAQDDPLLATLYYRDAQLVQAYADGAVARVIPLYGVIGAHAFPITFAGKTQYITLSSSDAMQVGNGIAITSGRGLTHDDVDSGANVGVLSQSAADKIFPAGNAVGHTINLGTQRVTIVGVYKIAGSLFNSISGDTVYVPYSTAHQIIPGPIDAIQFWAAKDVAPTKAIDAVRAALARIHPRGQYGIQDQGAELRVFENILASVGIGLTAIGGIALFVAGIGIMNIMLVSVSERMREIGIRKSIGASASDVGMQFLIEASLLSFVGGILGSAIGIAAVAAGRTVILQSIGAAPVPWSMVIGLAAGFSIAVGIGFGFYPAARAAHLDPVEALRS